MEGRGYLGFLDFFLAKAEISLSGIWDAGVLED